jgi:TolB protein
MNADGSEMKQLTHYPEDNVSVKEYGYKAGASRWHPTDNFITYVSKQDGRHSIFAVTPDGSKQWKLTDNMIAEGWHDWSPDGKWLAFNGSDVEESQFHITLMNWQTKEQKQLTDNTYKSQQAPVFLEK